jgi:hypothetical protein
VSRFCAEIQLSVKIREKSSKIIFHQKTHEARRRDEGEARGPHTHRGCGPALAAPTWCEDTSAVPSTSPFAYIYPLTRLYQGDSVFSQIDFRCAAAIRNRDSEPETPFWHPVRTGIWRRSSSPSSLTLLHRPSMTPPSMCE